MVALISIYIEKSCAAQAQSVCIHHHHQPTPALYSLRPVSSSWQVGGGGPSGGLLCLHKCAFGVDVRSFVPSVLPYVTASLPLPSDTDTIKRDAMGFSYGNGFCFALPSTSPACRWIPCSTRSLLQWPWRVPSWVPGTHRRSKRIWRQCKKTEQCEPHQFNLLYIFQYSSKSSLTFRTLEADIGVLKIPVIFSESPKLTPDSSAPKFPQAPAVFLTYNVWVASCKRTCNVQFLMFSLWHKWARKHTRSITCSCYAVFSSWNRSQS